MCVWLNADLSPKSSVRGQTMNSKCLVIDKHSSSIDRQDMPKWLDEF